MSKYFEQICRTVRKYLESNADSYTECEIQHGINFYVRRGSQSATVSVFYTGSIVIGFKKGSTQLRDELLKLKEDIEKGKLLS